MVPAMPFSPLFMINQTVVPSKTPAEASKTPEKPAAEEASKTLKTPATEEDAPSPSPFSVGNKKLGSNLERLMIIVSQVRSPPTSLLNPIYGLVDISLVSLL